MIKRYMKKPVIVEAIQFMPDNDFEVFDFCEGKAFLHKDTLIIPTLEGKMIANYGDYIIKGVAGEFYPCKLNIFEQTYDDYDDYDEEIEVKRSDIEKLYELLGCEYDYNEFGNMGIPPEKQLWLIIVLGSKFKQDFHIYIEDDKSVGNYGDYCFVAGDVTSSDPERFDEALAGLIIKLWDDIPESLQKEIKEILEE